MSPFAAGTDSIDGFGNAAATLALFLDQPPLGLDRLLLLRARIERRRQAWGHLAPRRGRTQEGAGDSKHGALQGALVRHGHGCEAHSLGAWSRHSAPSPAPWLLTGTPSKVTCDSVRVGDWRGAGGTPSSGNRLASSIAVSRSSFQHTLTWL